MFRNAQSLLYYTFASQLISMMPIVCVSMFGIGHLTPANKYREFATANKYDKFPTWWVKCCSIHRQHRP